MVQWQIEKERFALLVEGLWIKKTPQWKGEVAFGLCQVTFGRPHSSPLQGSSRLSDITWRRQSLGKDTGLSPDETSMALPSHC